MNKPIHFVTKKLKEYRDQKGWTQKELADFLSLQTGLNISKEMLGYWENRKRGLVAEQALNISKATGIELRELVNQK